MFLLPNAEAVIIRTHGKDFPFSVTGSNGLSVDSIDGKIPNNEELYEMISGIIN